VTYVDRTLNCVDCGVEFIHSAADQEYYVAKGFASDPKRFGDARMEAILSHVGASDLDFEQSYVDGEDVVDGRVRRLDPEDGERLAGDQAIGHAVEAKARAGVAPAVALVESALDGAPADAAGRDESAVDVEKKDRGAQGGVS